MSLRSPRGSTGFLRGDTFSTSALTNISEKSYHSCFKWRWKFVLIHVSLTSELPWQGNDAMKLPLRHFLLAFVFLDSGSFFSEIAEGSLYIGGGVRSLEEFYYCDWNWCIVIFFAVNMRLSVGWESFFISGVFADFFFLIT